MYGPDFATRAAVGSLAGTAAQAGFCLAYARIARRSGWPIALMAATFAYALAAVAYEIAAPPLFLLLVIVVVALGTALRLVPRSATERSAETGLPHRDIPARMLVAAGLVLGLRGWLEMN
jgi:uncharacterized membrane protein YfcA